MNNTLLSIVVSVYNLGSKSNYVIRRCLDSLLLAKKDTPFIQIIAVNDGSTDDSWDVLNEYKTQIDIYSKDNGGVGSCRNYGINVAEGKFITFVDGDDFVVPQYFDVILNHLNNLTEMFCFNYFNTTDETSKKDLEMKDQIVILNPHDGINRFLRFEFQEIIRPFVWNKIFKLEIIKKNGLQFDEKKKIGEDTLFTISYLEKIHEIEVNSACLYHYYQRSNSVMRSYNSFHVDDSIEYFRCFNKIARDNDYSIPIHDLITFYISRWFGAIHNESFSGNYKYGKLNMQKFINYPYFKENLKYVKWNKLNTKMKIYYILINLHLTIPIYTILYLKNSKRI